MVRRAIVGWAVGLALAGTATAAPSDLPDSIHVGSEEGPLAVLDAAHAPPCALRAGLCLGAGARSTVAVASAPLAAAAAPAGNPSKAAALLPRFARAASVAAATDSASPPSPESAPWTLELWGGLKRQAWAGNALFLFFDLEDPDAVENRQFTAMFQATLKATAKVAARVTLSPEEGFRAGHTYRLRIVQLISGKEILLAEADVSLL